MLKEENVNEIFRIRLLYGSDCRHALIRFTDVIFPFMLHHLNKQCKIITCTPLSFFVFFFALPALNRCPKDDHYSLALGIKAVVCVG